jgi:lysozyme family protein
MTDDERFALYRERLRPREGGLAERAGDPGGRTMEGISARLIGGRDPTALSAEERTAIYRTEFYERPQIGALAAVAGLDEAAPRLAEQMFDAGVLHGPGTAGRWLQAALNETLWCELACDGILGARTRAALAEAVREGRAAEVNDLVVDKRLAAMRALPNFAANPGWVTRAESFRQRQQSERGTIHV